LAASAAGSDRGALAITAMTEVLHKWRWLEARRRRGS